MSNETQKSDQNSTLNKLRNEFGQVNLTDGSEQKKAAALSFSGDGLYIGLKINTRTNPRTGAVEEPDEYFLRRQKAAFGHSMEC